MLLGSLAAFYIFDSKCNRLLILSGIVAQCKPVTKAIFNGLAIDKFKIMLKNVSMKKNIFCGRGNVIMSTIRGTYRRSGAIYSHRVF